MKQLQIFSTLCLLCLVAACQPEQRNTDPAPITEQAVRDFLQVYDTAWKNKDSLTVAQSLAPDYVYYGSTGGVSSRDQILDYLVDPTFAPLTDRRSELDVQLHGDIALVSSRWQGTGRYRSEPYDDDHRCSLVIRKDAGNVQLLWEHCTQIVSQ